jgi:hypothetical protein
MSANRYATLVLAAVLLLWLALSVLVVFAP